MLCLNLTLIWSDKVELAQMVTLILKKMWSHLSQRKLLKKKSFGKESSINFQIQIELLNYNFSLSLTNLNLNQFSSNLTLFLINQSYIDIGE